jgi:hypothetical protein
MWILIGSDYFNTNHIAVIRPVGNGDDQTVIFTPGQSSVADGFLVDVDTDSVFEIVRDSRIMELAQMIRDEHDESDADSDSDHLGPMLVERAQDQPD